jgi:hypothetical protein
MVFYDRLERIVDQYDYTEERIKKSINIVQVVHRSFNRGSRLYDCGGNALTILMPGYKNSLCSEFTGD